MGDRGDALSHSYRIRAGARVTGDKAKPVTRVTPPPVPCVFDPLAPTCTEEAEAMPAYILRGLIESQLDALIPANYLKALQVAEESERQAINLLANSL